MIFDEVKTIDDLKVFLDTHAVVVWSKEDVQQCAMEKGFFISDESAVEILKEIECNHDCQFGITWETISIYLDEYYQEILKRKGYYDCPKHEKCEVPLCFSCDERKVKI